MWNYAPITWKRALTETVKTKESIVYSIQINDQTFDIKDSGPQCWYKAIILGKSRKSGDKVAGRRMPYQITRETKLQSFQYRLLHRLITCKKYLHTIHMSEDDKCDSCGVQDSIIHFFVSCPVVQDFWRKLGEWCHAHLNFGLTSLTRGKVLGLTNDNGNHNLFKCVSWLLLMAKIYLHCQKLFYKSNISLIAFLLEVKNKLSTEKMICSHEGRPNKFKAWEKMLTLFSL